MIANKKTLLLRFSEYQKYSFIEEHKSIIKSCGYSWMLKIGKKIPDKRLKELFSEKNEMILRGPKAFGGKYYLAIIDKAKNGELNEGEPYPAYYEKMLDDDKIWMMDSLDGTWFKVKSIKEISNRQAKHLLLCSNDKPVGDVLESTRSTMLYVYSDVDF